MFYSPPPPPPPGIHRPAPERNSPKSAENYQQTQQSQINAYKANRPYLPYATSKVTGELFALYHMPAKHTNRHHSRKQAKQRAKRNAKR